MPKSKRSGNDNSSDADATILSFLRRQQSRRFVPMSFKVSQQFQRDYKLTAAQHGISMVDLLKESFALWKERHKR